MGIYAIADVQCDIGRQQIGQVWLRLKCVHPALVSHSACHRHGESAHVCPDIEYSIALLQRCEK